jgi:hypothetical protein
MLLFMYTHWNKPNPKTLLPSIIGFQLRPRIAGWSVSVVFEGLSRHDSTTVLQPLPCYLPLARRLSMLSHYPALVCITTAIGCGTIAHKRFGNGERDEIAIPTAPLGCLATTAHSN